MSDAVVRGEDDQFEDLVGAYVLDALDPEGLRSFEQHLAECERCQAEVTELRGVVDILPLAAPAAEPSTTVKQRLLREAGELGSPSAIPPVSGRPWWHLGPSVGLAVAAALVILALGVWNLELQQQLNQMPLSQRVALAIARGAVVSHIAGTPDAPGASAALVQPRGGGRAYLLVHGLPPSAGSRVYQLWLIRGAKAQSAGVFTYAGKGTKLVALLLSTHGYSLAALTREPGPHGSPEPTGKKLLLGHLQA